MSNISFDDFLEGFDLPAFRDAGGDWELLKTILKNAASACTTPSTTINSNKSEDKKPNPAPYKNTSININKSEDKKKTTSYTSNINTSASTLSSSLNEPKDTTNHEKPLYTVTIPEENVDKINAYLNKVKTLKEKKKTIPPDKTSPNIISKERANSVKVNLNENSNKYKATNGNINNKSSNYNSTNSKESNSTSCDKACDKGFSISSNEGIRTFLYGMKKRLPNTVKFFNNMVGSENAYHDLVYKDFSDETLNHIIEDFEKIMSDYNSWIDTYGTDFVKKIFTNRDSFWETFFS